MVMVSVRKLKITYFHKQLCPFLKYDTMKTLKLIDEKLHSLWTCRFRPLKLTIPEKNGVCVIRDTHGVIGVLLCP
jgi:hypothetical protein